MGSLARKIVFLGGIFFCVLLRPLCAEGERFDETWRWAQFTTESGLPSNRIIDLIETDDSTVWVLTTGGLAWYDGFRWNTVDSSYGLADTRVDAIMRYDGSRIIIRCGQRIYSGNRLGFSVLPIENTYEFAPLPPYGILIEKNSSLQIFDGSTLAPFTASRQQTEGKTIWLRMTRGGGVWAHLVDGLYRFENKEWKKKISFGDTTGVIAAVAENQHGTGIAFLTFPIEQRGLWEWYDSSPPCRNTTERPDNVRYLEVGPDDEAIVLYQSGDLRIRKNGSWSELAVPNVVVQDVNFVQFRKNHDVWFGTEDGLFLYKRSSSRWTFLKHPSPDLRNSINEILKTHDSSLWVATSDGIEVHHPDHSIESITHIGAMPLYVVTGLIEDRGNNIWISSGSSFTGTYRWDGKEWTHFDVSAVEGGIHIHKIRRDRSGRLWFLGIGKVSPAVSQKEPGAFLYTQGKFVHWGVEEGLFNGRIYSFDQGMDGSLWFGTSGALSRWRPREMNSARMLPSSPREGTWTHWTMAQGLRLNRVFALTVDHENHVWFGDHSITGAGLGTIDSHDSVRYFTTADGLVNDNIWDIRLDEGGTLWIATEQGLSSFRQGRWSTFDAQSGLLHPTLWPVLPEIHEVYVGTQGRGVAILNLEESSTPEPRIQLDVPTMEGKNIFLRWKAFTYWGELDPDEILTRCRLNQGLWSAWSKSKEFTISNLDPGEYFYDVQARGLFGGFHEEGTRGSFFVPQPYYLRPGFYFPTGILFLAVMVLGFVLLLRKRNHDIALRRSEEKFRTVMETTSSAIFIYENYRLVFVNSGAEPLTGYTVAELYKMNYLDLIHPDYRDSIEQQYQSRVPPPSTPHRYESKLLKKSGEERWIDCTAGGIQFQGRPFRLVTAFDITERKLAEQKLRSLASELSLTEERERRRMATYLHDVIGQTLAIVKMKIRGIQKTEVPAGIEKNLVDVCELVDQSILNAQTLTFDLCPPILYELSFEAAIEWLAEKMQNQHGIVMKFYDDRQTKKLGDDIRVLLFQAVREVLVNVVKHAEARNVDVSLSRNNGMICIIIRDDGTGFEIGDKQEIIQKEGGFGLFNIRERLTHFGGHLEINSCLGKGTEVTIVAPFSSTAG
jgi:PAS domain S-box-containing protein